MEMIQEKKMTDEYLERLKKKIDSLDDIVITEDGEMLRFPPKQYRNCRCDKQSERHYQGKL